MPKISVILPIYNVEKYLSQCLDSIVNQTLKDFECICVNDGSTDNSLSILQEYANKDSRIKIISQENKGVSAARNAGLKSTCCPYITFVDPDDWLQNNYLERLFNVAKETNSDIVECNYNIYYKSYDKTVKYARKDIIKSKKEDNVTYVFRKYYGKVVWNRIYKTELLTQNNILFYEGMTGEDTPFSILSYLYSKKNCFIHEELYFYRANRENSINTNRSKLYKDLFYNVFSLIVELKNRGIWSDILITYYINNCYWDFSSIFKKQVYSDKEKLVEFLKEIMLYIYNNTKSIKNKFKAKFLLIILKIFKIKSYYIIRILKNF